MQRLHGRFAELHNKRHEMVGHLFQVSYGAVRVTSDLQLHATAAYIARNPVEAGLVDAPEQYAWSSHGAAAVLQHAWLDSARLQAYLTGA